MLSGYDRRGAQGIPGRFWTPRAKPATGLFDPLLPPASTMGVQDQSDRLHRVVPAWAGALYPASAQRHLDIGSGAGFPALIIRILRSGAHLDLVEARGKRAAFLETVLAELQLSGVVVHNLRLEEFLRKSSAEGRWSIVSWKGVRLNARELSLIRAHGLPATQLWLFHGRRLPVESPATFLRFVRLIERFRCPYRESSHLSVFEFVGAALGGGPRGQE
ncbi:MAG: hypothetical protein DMG08_01270 [Acidobacteria bacterium]|nr:MAG: hypothetical protein DMG08_01270 [Acidobacteriota bacterium]